MTAMLVLRYTTAETSSVAIIRVLIILYTQCVLFEYPQKTKLVVCLKPVRFMKSEDFCAWPRCSWDECWVGFSMIAGLAEHELSVPVEIVGKRRIIIIMCIEVDLTSFSVEKFVANRCDPPKCGQC
jgi:hypothetical protein